MAQNISLNGDQSLAHLFVTETHEQLERFVEILLNWEQNGANSKQEVNELFRLAHNIKGSSGMMGLTELKDLVHLVENLLDEVRKERTKFDSEQIDLLLKFSDDVLAYIENGRWDEDENLNQWKALLDARLTETPLKPVKKADAPLTLTTEEKTEIAAWQEAGKMAYGIEVQFHPEAEMQGASALIFIKALPKYGKVYKTAPLETELKEEKFTVLKVVLLTERPLTPEQEAAIISYPVYDVTNVKIREWVYRPEEGTPAAPVGGKKEQHMVERTIRVEARKIEKLVNEVGELMNLKASLADLLDDKSQILKNWNRLNRVAQKLEQVTGSLQAEVMDLRMVPVRTLFSRFSRIAHDIAKQRGKLVELKFSGEETEIDKEIAEHLVDPLTHLIRNAVDHGLENEEARLKKGKPRAGQLLLEAYQEGDKIVISVSDDGQGLNIDKIRETGIRNGLIREDEEIAAEDLRKFIFQPGFSTADKVSDISGRGVGLDVVQESIKKLKGEIVVDSTPGQGTSFQLKVPLTMAIIQSFMVKLGGQFFGIPASEVVESLAVKAGDIHRIADKLVFSLRQEVITLIDLGKVLGCRRAASYEKIPLIVVKHGRMNYGLLVDELVGQEEIMIKQINKALAENPLISGAAFVGNGEIALILDTHQIIDKTVHREESKR